MIERTFQVGNGVLITEGAPDGRYSASFEDDGETGYFYAVDLNLDKTILDAVQIYNVANVVDRDRPSTLNIVWSNEGTKCALLIHGYAHIAVRTFRIFQADLRAVGRNPITDGLKMRLRGWSSLA